jgi:hypothetical protein
MKVSGKLSAASLPRQRQLDRPMDSQVPSNWQSRPAMVVRA